MVTILAAQIIYCRFWSFILLSFYSYILLKHKTTGLCFSYADLITFFSPAMLNANM